MPQATSALYGSILGSLRPFIGVEMADATLRMQCQALGITPDELGNEHLALLVPRLQSAMGVFIGRAKAGQLVNVLLDSAAGLDHCREGQSVAQARRTDS